MRACASLAKIQELIDEASAQPRRMGVGLFQTLAFFNHSCRPSCTYTTHTRPAACATAPGQTPPTAAFVEVTALRDISPGEELTIAYCDPLQGRWQRRRELWVRRARWRDRCRVLRELAGDGDAMESLTRVPA